MEGKEIKMNKYEVELEKKSNGPGYWDSTIVKIFQVTEEGKKYLGEYERSYGSFGRETFCPFTINGKDYALYSKDYTATRVMTLPDCKDLCGEESDAVGFCPVEFYVPYKEQDHDTRESGPTGEHYPFGFVAGCVWGDDTSWKIQYLDLTQIEKGIFKREERFGYLELPDNISLKEAIRFDDWMDYDNLSFLYIAKRECYRIKPDFSVEGYFPSDETGDLLRVAKYQGFKSIVESFKRLDNWRKKYPDRAEKLTEDEQKLLDLFCNIELK